MKTITLKEAYNGAPPVPLLNNPLHKRQPNLSILVSAIAENDHTAALLAHAYNVLPEVVVALEQAIRIIADEWPDTDLKAMGIPQMIGTLVRAKEVQIP